ncbi:11444_t:CDS:1, partial [Funneliformis caledonium]
MSDSDCEPNENDELEILEQIHNFEGAIFEVTRLSELDETLKEMLSNDQKNTEKN